MTAPPDVGRGAAVYEPVSSDRPDHDKYEQTKHDCERQSDLVGQFYRVQHAHQPPNHLIMQRLVQPQNRNKKTYAPSIDGQHTLGALLRG